jgi:hypothetical protein
MSVAPLGFAADWAERALKRAAEGTASKVTAPEFRPFLTAELKL